MGCACAREREPEEPATPKESLAFCKQRYVDQTYFTQPATRRKTMLLSSAVNDSVRHVGSHLRMLYRSDSLVYESGKHTLHLGEIVGTQKKCFIKTVSKQQGIEMLQQTISLTADLQRLARLDHPYVLRSYDVLQDDNNYYFVTEAFLGGKLHDHLKHFQSEDSAKQLLYQVFTALSYCHHQGIVHGGVNPDTIVFAETPGSALRTRLTGFGQIDATLGTKIDQSRFVAPEASTNANEKCDIWSCGVLLYQLLSGDLPTLHEKTLRQGDRRRSVTFHSTIWDGRSKEAISLVSALLQSVPQNRPTARQCLDHSWFTRAAPSPTVKPATLHSMLLNLRKMRPRNPLQYAVLRLILLRRPDDRETETGTEAFLRLDCDKDGVLKEDEVKASFLRTMSDAEATAATRKVMQAAEANSNGVVTFLDFLVAWATEKKLLSSANLTMAFSFLDKEKTGAVSLQELKVIFGNISFPDSERRWRELMLHANTTAEGRIGFAEFKKLIGDMD